ncbi:PEP-utilizing enzyme [Proteinivorax hydrogeniformans]|uniref:PEP-utilizing enzyme n=1 Tax=Proteinivorax hydrogeniformans TaxID=1826727 RepID=A0AAU8HVC0_9FIRM
MLKEILDGRRAIPQKKERSSKGGSKILAKGIPVVPGKLTGIARKFCKPSDLDNFKHGDILIATMTTPDIFLVIDKIAAIVTEQGGEVCHAAIVAREMDIPTIVGCGKFLDKVKDGEKIIIDGETGEVKKVGSQV